jgi:hypothetical protein
VTRNEALPARTKRVASVGVAEHGNSAELVTVARGGELLDRRRIDLTSGLPTHPHQRARVSRRSGRGARSRT